MVNMPDEEEIDKVSGSVADMYRGYHSMPLATPQVCLQVCFWSLVRSAHIETYKAMNSSSPLAKDVPGHEFLRGGAVGWGGGG